MQASICRIFEIFFQKIQKTFSKDPYIQKKKKKGQNEGLMWTTLHAVMQL